MFDVPTCPSCGDFLAPGAARCEACSRPDPEQADPWNSGTPMAVQAASATAVPPAAGSLLAAGSVRHRRAASRLPALALLLISAVAVGLLIDGTWLVVDLDSFLGWFDSTRN